MYPSDELGRSNSTQTLEAPRVVKGDLSIEPLPAGFWMRIPAFLIDVMLVNLLLLRPLGLAPFLYHTLGTQDSWFGFAIMSLYFTILEASPLQGTLGKLICGLIVADEEGNPINWRVSLLRNLLKFVSAIVFCIGFLIAFFTDKDQTFHDKVTHVVVWLR